MQIKVLIEVCDMRGEGRPGYVAKIGDRNERYFLDTPSYCDGLSISSKTVEFDLVEDGIYEISNATFGRRKRQINFILVFRGEEVFRSNSLRKVRRQKNVRQLSFLSVFTKPLRALMTHGTQE